MTPLIVLLEMFAHLPFDRRNVRCLSYAAIWGWEREMFICSIRPPADYGIRWFRLR
jgi:hypothetical protein